MNHWKRNTPRATPRHIPAFAPVFPPDWRVLYQIPLQQQESIRGWLKEFNLAEARQRVQSQLGVKLSRDISVGKDVIAPQIFAQDEE